MVALPVLIAPFRALLGFKSDTYKSSIGWKRIPYLWFGTLWQFGGLAIMPASLLVLGGEVTQVRYDIPYAGEVLAALAFLMTGLGMHMTQTAGLALAADRATDETRPRVVALLYVMFLVGMGVSAVVIGYLLRQFTPLELIQVIQGCAVLTVVLNVTALWKQERVRPMTKAEREEESPSFADAWADYASGGTAGRLLVVVFLGTMAFNMQDVLLEPYGGEILGPVGVGHDASDGDMGRGALTGSRLPRAGWPRGSTPTAWARAASSPGSPRFRR
jgi:BCD family chlorophyll transporter-like MFS transporter